MNDLNMEKFSPKKAELITLSEKYKALTIKGVEDEEGYLAVDEARKDLKRKRVDLKKTGKELRQEARDWASAVIVAENELVQIIEPLEKELKDKQDKVDDEKLIEQRRVLLPERKESLKEINIEITDDELLLMSPEKFQEFYNHKNSEYLAEKAQKIKEDEDRIARQKEIDEAVRRDREEEARIVKQEADKKAQEAKDNVERLKKESREKEEQIKKEAKEREDKIKRDADEKADKVKKQAEADRQKIIEDQKIKDDKRIADEKSEKERKEKEAKELSDKKAKEEKAEKYVKFLEDNGCTLETKDEFYVVSNENQKILYKKVATYNLDELIYKMDGNMICCHGLNFTNLQECVAGFGKTNEEAKADYLNNLK